MDLWRPPHDRPTELAWWRPLAVVARVARRDRVGWPVRPADFELRGRVDRGARPSIWVYADVDVAAAGVPGELHLDGSGRPHRFVATPGSRSPGRFHPCDLRAAMVLAGLHRVVEPTWSAGARPAAPVGRGPGPAAPPSTPSPGSVGRRRGHLVVVGPPVTAPGDDHGPQP